MLPAILFRWYCEKVLNPTDGMCDQKGSFVDDEKLRFDFSWSGALSPEQVRTFHENGRALWPRTMDVAHLCPTCKQRGRCRFHVPTETILGLVDSQEKGNVAASHDQGYSDYLHSTTNIVCVKPQIKDGCSSGGLLQVSDEFCD